MDLIKLLNGTKEDFIPKGEKVEHKYKDEICKIMPENYSIKGLIEYEIVGKKAGREPGLRGRQDFTASELFGLSKKNAFMRNLRDLRDIGSGNPYNSFAGVTEIPKEEADKYFNIKDDYKVIALTSKQETEIVGKTKLKIALLAFVTIKPVSENISEDEIMKLLGASDALEELEEEESTEEKESLKNENETDYGDEYLIDGDEEFKGFE